MSEADRTLSNISGKIFENEKVPNSKLKRLVETKIRDWLNATDLPENTQADYKVSFFSESSAKTVIPEVSCLISIRADSKSWKGWEAASTPQLAFIRTLKAIQMNPEH